MTPARWLLVGIALICAIGGMEITVYGRDHDNIRIAERGFKLCLLGLGIAIGFAVIVVVDAL